MGLLTDEFNTIIISETHWDRAWYQTFEQFRLRLVKLVDNLLDILHNDPDFKHYTFDGQTVVLEDYLEVKPHRRNEIEELVKNGRLDIGPWYILPDVYLVSGESLIRNLLRGRRIAAEFGRCMNEGYIPDPFGHVSQLPQIFSQFGIDSIIFARGTGEETTELGSEFIWEATDGSEILAHWLPLSYGNAASLPDDVDDAVSVIEDVLKQLKPWSKVGTYLLMNGSDHLEPQVHLPKVVQKFNETHDDKIVIGTLPMFVDRIREKRSSLKRFRGEFRRSKHQNLLSGVYSARVYIKQANEYGQRLLERTVEPWCTVSRLLGHAYPNDEIRLAWKYLLLNHPHDDICGCSIDEVHNDNMQRFRWIGEITKDIIEDARQKIMSEIQTPEAGIAVFNPSPYPRTGVAIVEMPASDIRYARIANIQLKDHSLKPSTPLEAAKNEVHIAWVRDQGIDLPPTAEREIPIGNETLIEYEFDFSALALLFPAVKDVLRHLCTAFRIRVNSKKEIVEVWARKFDAHGEASGPLTLEDADGNIVPIQLLDFEMKKDPLNHQIADAEEYMRFAILADGVPGIGLNRYNFSFEEVDSDAELPSEVICSETRMENSFVIVEVKDNGTITLTDKRNGETYKGLLEFEDSGDVGDEYDYAPTKGIVYRSRAIEVDFEEGYEGPLVGSMIVAGAIRIPAAANENDLTRTEEYVDCDFLTEVTLTADSPTVKVLTAFNNVARDHRLRVLFPSGTDAATCTADSTFDVLDRPIRPKEYSDWQQPVAPTYPLRTFVNLSGKGRGLSVTTKGLLEFEILEEQGSTIALTLVRSVGWLSKIGISTRRENAGPIVMTPGGQCLGANVVEFSITPHSGDWMSSETYLESEKFLLPLEAAFIPKNEEATGKESKGFVDINPSSIQLAALKESEDGECIVLRVWNISEEEQESTFRFGINVSSIKSARMDEVEDDSLNINMVDKNSFKTKIPSRRIATFLIQPE